jgi:hypothetical protein
LCFAFSPFFPNNIVRADPSQFQNLINEPEGQAVALVDSNFEFARTSQLFEFQRRVPWIFDQMSKPLVNLTSDFGRKAPL